MLTTETTTAHTPTNSKGQPTSTSAETLSLPTTSTPPARQTKCDLSGGAVAGVSIATAVIGALIAAVVVLFVMSSRRKKNSHRKYDIDQGDGRGLTRSRRAPSDQGRGEKAGVTADVSLILPQPLDDKTLEAEVEKFFKFVEGHVDSGFYHDKPFDAIVTENERPGQRSVPLPLGVRSQPGIELELLLADPSTRRSAITCLICAEALSRIEFRGEIERSLLPAVVTSFISSMDPKMQNTHASRLSLSRWRTSTSFLLGNEVNDSNKVHRDRAIQLLIQDLNEILRPFASSTGEDQRNADLVSISKRAEKLGLILLSQPAEWAFEWRWNSSTEATGKSQSRSQPRQSLIVFPGLLKVTDNSATVLDKPRVVLNPRFVR